MKISEVFPGQRKSPEAIRNGFFKEAKISQKGYMKRYEGIDVRK